PHMEPLPQEHVPQHPTPHPRVFQMERIHASHHVDVFIGNQGRRVVHAAPGNPEEFGLAADSEGVIAADHFFSPSNPALPSALSKKSISSACCPILAW